MLTSGSPFLSYRLHILSRYRVVRLPVIVKKLATLMTKARARRASVRAEKPYSVKRIKRDIGDGAAVAFIHSSPRKRKAPGNHSCAYPYAWCENLSACN